MSSRAEGLGFARALLAVAAVVCVGAGRPAIAQERSIPPISDEEFEAALPPLDEVAPLSTAPSPIRPLTSQAELLAPLTPLAAFDERPPLEITVADDTGLAQVGYTVSLTGLAEVGLDDDFRALSALLQGSSRTAPASQIRLRADEDALLARKLLQAEGYYDAAAQVSLAPPAGKTDRLDVTLAATAGHRYFFGDIKIVTPEALAKRIAEQALLLRDGDPIVATAVESSEARIALRLPEGGYPFASIGPRDILLNETTYRGDYSLPVASGPRASFGAIHVVDPKVFDAAHITSLARFERGSLYDSRQVEDLRQALIATSLLSSVALEPVRTGQTLPDGTEAVDLRVTQVPGPSRSLSASAGYGTGEGYRLALAWTHRNFFPPEGALGASAVFGAQEQRLGVTFRRSNAGRRDRSVQAIASISREDREAYTARSVNLSGRVARESTPLWQKKWTYAYGAELIATDESRYQQTSADRPRNTYLIAALPGQLGYDASDDLLDPSRGFRVNLRLSPELGRRDGVSTYARSQIDASAYAPFGSNLVIAGRARIGVIAGAERDQIAPSRRLYAGGGGSVRGFGYQDLGPRNTAGDPTGGRSSVEFSLEARYRWKDFGIVPFVDVGQAYAGTTPAFEDLRVGVGIGGRYYTPFGPVRIDVATPLSRRANEPKVALYISIGQAF